MRRLKSTYSSIYICRYKQMTRRNKTERTDGHRAKIALWMICEYIREQCWEEDELGEWGTSVKEYWLMGFQQRVGSKIPTEEEEQYHKPFTTNINSLKSRRRRANKKLRERQDYENYLKEMRLNYKKK